jgi:predicted transposase YdaD
MKKKKSVPNPHDTFVRHTLGRVPAAVEFLRNYLPPDIVVQLDLTRVTLEETSYVDEQLREHFSDLLYRVGLRAGGEAFVFILLEHKSAPDTRVAIQLLRYLAQTWDRMPEPLPLIIPVVIYHGEQPWNVGRRLRDLFGALARNPLWAQFFAGLRLSSLRHFAIPRSRLARRAWLGRGIKSSQTHFRA